MKMIQLKLPTLDAQLAATFPNLEDAVARISQDFFRYKAGMGSPERFAGIYLLIGTTSRNPLPRVFASMFYGEEVYYIPMSQYTKANSIALLRQHLISVAASPDDHVLLLGDIDQAHPAIRRWLTKLSRTARLADDQHNPVDLTRFFLFMTTTAFADVLHTPADLDQVHKRLYSVFERSFITPISLMIPFYGKV